MCDACCGWCMYDVMVVAVVLQLAKYRSKSAKRIPSTAGLDLLFKVRRWRMMM